MTIGQAMKRAFLSAAAILCLTEVVSAQSKLTGAWDMRQISEGFKNVETSIVQSNTTFMLLARSPHEKWGVVGEGKVSDRKVTVEKAKDKFEQLNGKTFTFDGNMKLITSKPDGSPAKVAVMRLSSLYLCGNHVPTNHIASSLTEMKRLTGLYKCAQWHSSDSDKREAGELITKMLAMPATDEK
jgi:hypothetical protein